MLGNSPFYFGLMRQYVALMGSTVDNIYIEDHYHLTMSPIQLKTS